MPLASAILDESRNVYLNDPLAKLYTNVTLLPILRKAYRDMQQEMVDNGISVSREASAALTLVANTLSISSASSPALPTDLLWPIELHEKFSDEADTAYVPMIERAWEPDATQSQRLVYWTWREEEIKLVGATGTVLVRIRYFKSLSSITDANTNIPILDSQSFLAARTAALAAFTIGNSPTKASALSDEANSLLETFLSTAVKSRQDMPIRRPGFRGFRRSGTYWGR
jgi:hypothetical protein